MKDCVEKGVRCVHFFTARVAETGRKDAADLEQEILAEAKKGGVRIIGPNCMGLYNRRLGVKFTGDLEQGEEGDVSVLAQSGTHTMHSPATHSSKGSHSPQVAPHRSSPHCLPSH